MSKPKLIAIVGPTSSGKSALGVYLAQKLGGEMLNGLPLYTVKPEDLTVGSTQYSPKDMQITDKGLQITLNPVR